VLCALKWTTYIIPVFSVRNNSLIELSHSLLIILELICCML